MHTSSVIDTNPNNFPPEQQLKCPRCDSINTKFCYYNNYNLSQPRHFCKNCRRYWTKGGTLRNIPIGGGTRKITKRVSNPSKRTSPVMTSTPPPPPPPTLLPETSLAKPEPYGFESGGYSMGSFGNLLMEGLVSKSDVEDDVLIQDSVGDEFRSNFLKLNDNNQNNNGGGDNGWPDLSIFTPGSSFH